MTLPVSVLDVSPVDAGSAGKQALRNTIALAQLADRLGYTRYWLAEHHNSTRTASPAPEIMIGHIADATERIRVGSGGIMLPNHTSLKVAEMFHVLEALHPGRIDLGIGRAPGSDGRTALALRGSREGLNADDFPQQLAELLAFSGQGEGFPIGHPFRTVRAEPSDVELPPIWLLGSSDFGAQVAAAMGVGFAFAHHINAGYAVPAIKMYRNQFISSERMPESKVILAASAVCAETDERAEELASSMRLGYLQMRSGRLGPLPSLEEARAHHYTPAELAITKEHQQIIGRPEVVRKQLLKLVEQTGADELMITAVVYGYENRAKTFELLADAFDLQSPPKAASTENIPS